MAQRLLTFRAMYPRSIAMVTLSLGLLVDSAQAQAEAPPQENLPSLDEMVPPSAAPVAPALPSNKASGSAGKTEFIRYGHKIVVGLVASDLVTLSGFGMLAAWGWGSIAPLVILTGAGGHWLTGPIVHWSRGHVARGFESLTLHTLVPVVTCFLGGAAGSQIHLALEGQNDSGWGMFYGASAGLVVGGISSAIIDVGLLAQDPKPARVEQSARALPITLSVVPMVGTNQWGLSVVGRM